MSEINQITTIRLPDGKEVAFVDWSDTPLFSSADFLAGFDDTEIDLFQYVPGDDVPSTGGITVKRTSSENDTNIAAQGSMASTEEMLVYALRPEVMEWTLATQTPTDANSRSPLAPNQPRPTAKRLAILQSSLLLTLEVSQKFMLRAPLTYFNSGMGVFSTTVMAGPALAGNNITAGSPGFPGQDAVRALVIPAHIGGQEKYRVRIENVLGQAVPSGLNEANPAVDAPLIMHTIRVYMDGLYKRPVS